MQRKNSVQFIIGCMVIMVISCNMSGPSNAERKAVDKSKKTVIDSSEYVDFTMVKNNAHTFDKKVMVQTVSGRTYRNGNSYIKIAAAAMIIEIGSDRGLYEDQANVQVYGKFGFELIAASADCLYIRRNPRVDGLLLLNNQVFHNDQIPDIGVCLPLYGYSRNRIEVSSIMDGFIIMPSGTYWYQ